ncbi:hypothetical protein DPMN_079506 [Dreissena polymorpha]|uniref:Uncharacterized protein n=1 Tax=Dreissena polymorpha TaxID=45954 RepID=A0A9D3YT82_DREPO|nr:hypothetical protein DPMN_079506 [Dreissena polymorpha]
MSSYVFVFCDAHIVPYFSQFLADLEVHVVVLESLLVFLPADAHVAQETVEVRQVNSLVRQVLLLEHFDQVARFLGTLVVVALRVRC